MKARLCFKATLADFGSEGAAARERHEAALEVFLASLDPSVSEALAGLLRNLCSRKRRRLEEL